MVYKLKLSEETEKIFADIQASKGLAPFILTKLSLAMGLKDDMPLSEDEKKTDTKGLELHRQQVTGEYDNLYLSLIRMCEGNQVLEKDIFPSYVKGYIDRGAKMLRNEFKYARDIYEHLATLEKSI